MKDLLYSDTSSAEHYVLVSLVVDNARCRISQSSLDKNSGHNKHRRRTPSKSRDYSATLGGSDQSLKESRWETSSPTEFCQIQTMATPLRPKPGTFGSPVVTGNKRPTSARNSPSPRAAPSGTSRSRDRISKYGEDQTLKVLNKAIQICKNKPVK